MLKLLLKETPVTAEDTAVSKILVFPVPMLQRVLGRGISTKVVSEAECISMHYKYVGSTHLFSVFREA